MASGGITFGLAAPFLARVVDNGISYDDPRVIERTNAATKLILDHMIPVGGMATFTIVGAGTDGRTFLLPKELENAIAVDGDVGAVNGTYLPQGWVELVNNFAYIDPNAQHDNPLVDQFLQPDPSDPTILRRQYYYPNIQTPATINVTGAKRYLPIIGNNDYLIVQNIEALKRVILSIERTENNAPDEADKYLKQALEILQSEVKKHLLDPINSLKRKAAYQHEVLPAVGFPIGSLGNIRARLALEVPGYLAKGRIELSDAINHALGTIVTEENTLRFAGRLGVHESITELVFSYATNDHQLLTDLIPGSIGVQDFDIIRRLCASYFATDPAQAQPLEDKAIELLGKRLTERMEFLRHNDYTNTLNSATAGTVAWTIARLALEVPGGLSLTTVEMQRTFEMAEKRLIDLGKFKDTIELFTADVVAGEVFFPPQIETVLAIDLDGIPIPVRGALFEYLQNGPGIDIIIGQRLVDMGEIYFPENGLTRRKYLLRTTDTVSHTISIVGKIRWYPKAQNEPTTIKNFEALRLMTQAIILEYGEKWQEAAAAAQSAKGVLDRELAEFLAGIEHTIHIQTYGFGLGDVGNIL
jgi:hypothetical protein